MIAVGAIGFAMVLQRLAVEQDSVSFERSGGPFRATVNADGTVQLGVAVAVLHRGEAFGWAGTLCAGSDAGMLVEARLVHLSDNAVLLYRERALPLDAHGCASAVWDIVLPVDAPLGRYQVQRFVLLTPRVGGPLTRVLRPLSVEVRA